MRRLISSRILAVEVEICQRASSPRERPIDERGAVNPLASDGSVAEPVGFVEQRKNALHGSTSIDI
jgi:hypothetical protein